MIRFSFYSVLVFLALFASAVYLLKYDVQELKSENARLQKNIAAERLAMELLEAEWVYLNRPGRLQVLAEKHLHAVPMAPNQIISFMDIPKRPHDVAQLEE